MPGRLSSRHSRHLRVASVQMRFAADIPGNLQKIADNIEAAAKRGADVILFPECATTGYHCDFAAIKKRDLEFALENLSVLARENRINVLIGSPHFAGRSLQNCLFVFDRRGRVVHRYAKCQLTEADRRIFKPGNSLALFEIEGVPATAIICHERRYPEMVRLPVMAGAKILFHPNAGLDTLAVSKTKRNGRDGIAVRAFENAIFYVFANSIGPQGGGKWSAGDSKIVAPDSTVLALANNRDERLIVADLDLSQATRKYAVEATISPRFLASFWRQMIRLVKRKSGSVNR